jgi:DHA3 family macrolide efflux protein-like MFS transporter
MTSQEIDRMASREIEVPADGVRTFTIVSIGQFLAVTGITIFNFAGAYFFYGKYVLLVLGLFYALPFIAFVGVSPFAGALIDRWGVKRVLLTSNIGGIVLVATLALVPLTQSDATVIARWHACVIITTVPLLKALLLPAFESSVPVLIPTRHFGRANGMRMFINAIGAVLGPIVAVLLVQSISIYGVGLVALVCLLAGVFTLLPARIPVPRRDDAIRLTARVLLADARQGWNYVWTRPGLPALLFFFGITSFGFGFVEVLLPDIVGAFASTFDLDLVFICAVVGLTAVGIAVTISGGPRRRVRGMLAFQLLMTLAMVVASLRPNVAVIAVCGFVFLGCTSIIVCNIQTILCTKVELHMIGRVMAWKNSFYGAFLQLGDILAATGSGVVVLVGKNQVRWQALAAVIGNGPDRGYALLMLVAGLVVAFCSIMLAYRYRPLRDLEVTLPDATPLDATLGATAVS